MEFCIQKINDLENDLKITKKHEKINNNWK